MINDILIYYFIISILSKAAYKWGVQLAVHLKAAVTTKYYTPRKKRCKSCHPLSTATCL